MLLRDVTRVQAPHVCVWGARKPPGSGDGDHTGKRTIPYEAHKLTSTEYQGETRSDDDILRGGTDNGKRTHIKLSSKETHRSPGRRGAANDAECVAAVQHRLRPQAYRRSYERDRDRDGESRRPRRGAGERDWERE